MSKTQGKLVVYASPYCTFDPANPRKTAAGQLTYYDTRSPYLESSGYVEVGSASITIDFFTPEQATVNAISAIEKQQTAVLAEAQLQHTKLEQRKQELLAIKG